MIGSVLSLFVASLIGSPHCAGMCGGFVAVYSKFGGSHLGYSVGRLVTYLTLGAVAGYAGSEINSLSGLGHLAAVGVGAVLVIEGLRGLITGKTIQGVAHSPLSKPLELLLRNIERTPRALRSFFVGLFSTLIPCGWLYTFVALAAASGSLKGGMLVLAVFWLGTLPVMLSVGTLFGRFLPRFGNFAPRLTCSLVVLAGLFSIGGHYLMSLSPNGCGCH